MRIDAVISDFRSRTSLTLAIAGAVIITACGGGGGTDAVCEVTSVAVAPQGPTVDVGKTLTLSATVAQEHCNPAPAVNWSSNATGIASVSNDGVVTGVSAGTAQITAATGGRSGTTTVTVRLTPVATVIVLFDDPSIAVGQKTTVQVELRDAQNQVLANREVRWSVSDMARATVPPGSDWTFCSNEHSTCTFTGTKQVRYGANGTYAYREVTSSTPCTNEVFGDPLVGVPKQCHSAELAKTTSGGAGLEVTAVGAGSVTLVATPVENPGSVTGSEQVTITPPVFDYVAGGVWHTCARRTDGATYCWGSDGDYDELARLAAYRASPSMTAAFTSRLLPTLISGGPPFAELVGGGDHVCGRASDGAAYCWQNNLLGQVGDNTTTNRATPTPVSGGLSFTGLTAGEFFSCGRATTGTSYCWGHNSEGQLGDGTTTDRLVPTAVSGAVSFTKVEAGGRHACGLTAAGAAYCWGSNHEGQVGDNSTTQRSAPTPVAGGLAFVDLTLGSLHSCGRTAAGAAYCWGYNGSGEVGDNTTVFRRLVPTLVSGGHAFVELASTGQTTCGRTAAGAAFCWGNGFYGSIGDGTSNNAGHKRTPTAVSGGLSFVQLAGGGLHMCGRVAAGDIYCWGRNADGQLGDGTTTNRLVPTRVVMP